MDVHRIQRMGHWAIQHRLKLLAKFFRMVQRVFLCCDIPFQVDLEEDVHFSHNGFGIVINPRVSIGAGTDVQHSVTIGEIESGGGCPQIGKNVYIGARAILLGEIKIGDGAVIGAGSVVLTDVPPGCTMVGVPARAIVKD